MSRSRWLMVAALISFAGVPSISEAQISDSTKARVKDEAQDFVHDVLRAILGPHWNVFAQGGTASDDRFLLQQAVNPSDGKRALVSATGYNLGLGAGVDVLLHTGFRLGYTFASRHLNYRTDNGTGSDALNIDGVGTLQTHTVALEVMRYMLPFRAAITPYGTVGVQGTWWALRQKSPLVTSGGASTPFSIRPTFAFGLQFKASSRFSTRLEAMLSSAQSPFNGNRSFIANAGPTIDQSTGVSRTNFSLGGVYYFARPSMPSLPATMTHE